MQSSMQYDNLSNDRTFLPDIKKYTTYMKNNHSDDFFDMKQYTSYHSKITTDRDECETGTHNCDHTCHNTEGGYFCTCDNGYMLIDSHSCKGSFMCNLSSLNKFHLLNEQINFFIWNCESLV